MEICTGHSSLKLEEKSGLERKSLECMTLAGESIPWRISVCLVKLHPLSAQHPAVAPSTVGEMLKN